MNKHKQLFEGLTRTLSKYASLIIFIYFILVTGITYAYYTFNRENTTAIVGNVVGIDADLDVELVVGTNSKMVPLKDDALSNAIKGTGGVSACVDANNNLSCQVYKITLKNNASRIEHLTGIVELYAKDGSGNVYNNLNVYTNLLIDKIIKDYEII